MFYCVVSGYYCVSPGLTNVTGPCLPGYYCPGGQAVADPVEYPCPQGMYCPEGTAIPIMCPNGTYQDHVGQDACLECPSRYYCDPYELSTGNNDTGIIFPLSCPSGYYCPPGTAGKNSYACLPGTYSDAIELEADSKFCKHACFFYLHF